MNAKEIPIEPGALIKGYEIVEQVGKGGMGAVYRAKAPNGEFVALKILAAHLTDNEIQRKRFYQEAEVAMKLDHPNIVRAIEVGEANGQHFFAMEFVEGENLGKKIKDFGRMPEDEAARIISEVAEALDKAHNEGLIHRDVKPDNIMVTPTGAVKLADMGLMKQLENDMNLTKTGKGLGTPHFMAPEQFRDAKHADARCDVYSLGATLYMMVTGELPFRGSGPLDAFIKKSKNEYRPPKEINPELSQRMADIIQLTMDAEPGRRPQTARAFIEMLAGKTPVAPPAAPVKKAPVAEVKDDKSGLWYVIFLDEHEKEHKVKGTTAAIEKQIEKGKIGPDARVSRSKAGPFEPIVGIAEFERILRRAEKSEPIDVLEKPAQGAKRVAESIPSTPRTARPPGRIPNLSRRQLAFVVGVSALCLLAAAWYWRSH